MFLGLRTVLYAVPDLAAATKWYSEAFGTEPYFNQPYYVGFDIGGFELGLLPDAETDTGKGRTVGVTAYWGVDDCDAAYARLLQHGAASRVAVEDVGDGIRHASVTDPWGNVIGVIENPHFGKPRP